MQKVLISSRDGQATSDHNGTTNLLNRLNLPAPPWSTVMEMAGNGVPRAVGQGRCALLPGLQVPRINGTGQVRQGFGSGSQGELDGSGRLSSVGAGLKHGIDSLWSSAM